MVPSHILGAYEVNYLSFRIFSCSIERLKRFRSYRLNSVNKVSRSIWLVHYCRYKIFHCLDQTKIHMTWYGVHISRSNSGENVRVRSIAECLNLYIYIWVV